MTEELNPRPPKLSAEEQSKRRPRPPEELVNARHDRVHKNTGRVRAVKSVKVKIVRDAE